MENTRKEIIVAEDSMSRIVDNVIALNDIISAWVGKFDYTLDGVLDGISAAHCKGMNDFEKKQFAALIWMEEVYPLLASNMRLMLEKVQAAEKECEQYL